MSALVLGGREKEREGEREHKCENVSMQAYGRANPKFHLWLSSRLRQETGSAGLSVQPYSSEHTRGPAVQNCRCGPSPTVASVLSHPAASGPPHLHS